MTEEQIFSKFRLTITLCIVAIIVIFAIQNLISPNLLILSNLFGFGIDATPLGIVQSTFMFLGGASMVAFGYLSDKMNRVRILFVGTLLFSIPSIFIALVGYGIGGYTLFFVLQVICGLGLGMAYPTAFSLTGDIVPAKDRSKGFSYFSIATNLGIVFASLLGALMPPNLWQVSYILFGIAGLVCASFLFFLKEPSRLGRDFLYLAGKDAVDYSYRIRLTDVKVIFKKKANVWLIINFVSTIPMGIILFLLYDYLQLYHGVPKQMALAFLAIVVVALFAGTIVFGMIADNFYKKGNKRARVIVCVFSNTAPIPFILIGVLVPFQLSTGGSIADLFSIPNAQLMIILVTIGIFLVGGCYGPWYATVVDLNLPEHRGTVLSLANFFETIGKSVGPLIGSILADKFGIIVGIGSSVIFMAAIPFFWIEIVRHFVPELEETERIFQGRIAKMAAREGNENSTSSDDILANLEKAFTEWGEKEHKKEGKV
ncbi:MAG TPA: MFS transporter [Candidatus Lokiarchaeia archaeon]|nr:MFS transporter [Candidatus Lokiarchaeia archaeon]